MRVIISCILAAGVLFAARVEAQSDINVLLIDREPLDDGSAGIRFEWGLSLAMEDSGRVVAVATSVDSQVSGVVLEIDEAGSRTVLRGGDPTGTGFEFHRFNNFGMASDGSVGFLADIRDALGYSRDAYFMMSPGGAVRELARTGVAFTEDPSLSVQYLQGRPAGLNALGEAVVRVALSDGSFRYGIVSTDSEFSELLRNGDPLPGGGHVGGGWMGGDGQQWLVNDAGQTALAVTVGGTGVTGDSVLLRLERDGTYHVFARTGDPVPGRDTVYGADFVTTGRPSNMRMNQSGQILSDVLGADLILTGSGQDVRVLAGNGDSLPRVGGGSAIFTGGVGAADLNDFGEAAFVALLANGEKGVYLVKPGETPAPVASSGGFFNPTQRISSITDAVGLSPNGLVAFLAIFNDLTGPEQTSSQGVFLSDGQETLLIAKANTEVEGVGLGTFEWPSSMVPKQAIPVNSSGQVLLYATPPGIANYRRLVMVTPELNWRGGSGTWEEGGWTLGLAPAAVHGVRLTTDIPVVISGPESDLTIARLVLGGGEAETELRLRSGVSITLPQGMTIEPNGLLSGQGTITGSIINNGIVSIGDSLGTLNVTGDFTQTGRLVFELESPDAFDRLIVDGDVVLGGILELVFGYAPEVGAIIEPLTAGSFLASDLIIETSGLNGRWAVTDPAGRIHVVPEPVAGTMLLVLAGLLLRCRTRGRTTGAEVR